MSYNFLILKIVFLQVLFINGQSDYNLTLTLNFSGQSTCTDNQCEYKPYPSQYACSPSYEQVGDWNNGQASFQDPLLPGYIIMYVNMTFFGSFYCSASDPPTTFIALLNDFLFLQSRFTVSQTDCNCSTCFTPSSTFSTVNTPIGFAGYNYGDLNSLTIKVIDNFMCLSYLNLTFIYSKYDAVIISVDPSSGTIAGGTRLTLTGLNLPNVTDDIICRFGNSSTTSGWRDIDQTIKCITPPHSIGTVQIYVKLGSSPFFGGIEYQFKDIPPSTNLFQQIWDQYWWTLVIIGLIFITVIFMCISSYRKRKKQKFYSLESQPLLSSGRNSFKIGTTIDFREIQLAERIGRGNFGEVFKGYWRRKEVAVKKTKIPVNDDDAEEFIRSFELEAKIMSSLRHPNVLQFLGICSGGPNEVCIITEYMPRGSLYKILHDKNLELSWDLRLKICLDVSHGVDYLHNSDPMIIHRDLKSHNLLVDENFKVKVCDFGLAKLLDAQQTLGTMTSCGTPAWTAPEVLRNEKYTKKCDVYSFGIVLWELITRDDPHHGMPPFQVVFAVGTQGIRPPIPTYGPPLLIDLMQECWSENPEQRPLFDEILQRLEEIKKAGWEEDEF